MIPCSERAHILRWVEEAHSAGARLHNACQLLGLSVRTLQRWREADPVQGDGRTQRVHEPRNKLSDAERAQVLAVANSAEFAPLPPSQIVPRLAERGQYIASESTFYRILRATKQVQHRLASRPAMTRHQPRALHATAPNQLYSWDITYLPTPLRGVFFYLYVFLDVYSRKIVGWQVYEQESSAWAAELVRDIVRREGLPHGHVTLHSDNGGPMKGATMLATLQRLGIMPSFSRPAVSNDNPYSEALFKTLKYCPAYPEQPFSDLLAARQWVAQFVDWYNEQHRHSAIQFVTPAQRHAGQDKALLAHRHEVYEKAKAQHPERWSGRTRNWHSVPIVYLNPDKSHQDHTGGTTKKAA